MEIKFILSLFKLLILIINITFHDSSYLSVGLNQLNNFIYLQRIKDLTLQSYSEQCSLSKGPNCFFAENQRSEIYEKNDNNEKINYNLNDILDLKKEWMDFYIKSKEIGFLNTFTDLNDYLTQYKDYISSSSDTSQIPQPLILRLSLTFESYDDITIKEDIYAYASKPIQFLTETVFIEIVGKLRLTYGEDLKLKDQSKYPCKTFGIIESNNLIIKLGGKRFVCESFFMRIRDDKMRSLIVSGYSGNIKVFSMTREINYMTEKSWLKIDLPASKIDRLVLPGGIDVDNFRFTIETIQHYDVGFAETFFEPQFLEERLYEGAVAAAEHRLGILRVEAEVFLGDTPVHIGWLQIVLQAERVVEIDAEVITHLSANIIR